MKKLLISMCMAMLMLTACTKSEEFHPEMGYGDYEVITVKPESVHIRYFWKDMERHSRTFFCYRLKDSGSIYDNDNLRTEMSKKEDCFDLVLTDLLPDTTYYFYYLDYYWWDSIESQPSIHHTSSEFHTQPLP